MTKTTIDISTPKPVNFLRVVKNTIDVGLLSDENAEKIGEAIKQDFIENVRKRRAAGAEEAAEIEEAGQ